MNVTTETLAQWANVQGADSYQAQLQSDIGTLQAVANPAVDDPDGDKIVDIPEDAGGTTSVSLGVWLANKPLGNYKFFVRSKFGSITGVWTPEYAISYVGPAAPVVTFV